MTINFTKCDFGLGVYYDNKLLEEPIFTGSIEKQEDGSVIYNSYAEINYGVNELEQVLSKMKELQSESKL